MHSRFLAIVLLLCSTAAVGGAPKQAILGHRSTPLLTVDGLTFKDLDRNGKLDPYEDWLKWTPKTGQLYKVVGTSRGRTHGDEAREA